MRTLLCGITTPTEEDDVKYVCSLLSVFWTLEQVGQ